MSAAATAGGGAPGVDVQARQVSRRFGEGETAVDVLQGVDLTLAGGDALAIMGPSGSGKSTLLQILGTLDRPTSGRVSLAGRDPFALSEPELARFRNASVGFIFQDHKLLPQYSVLENVLLPTAAFPAAGAEARAAEERRARELIERVGLSHRLTHRPGELSGGERQRVAVARALIRNPFLVLCDEPTGNLDGKAAGAVADLLFELQGEEGTILVAVTHSPDLAARFPRRARLSEGRLIEEGEPAPAPGGGAG